MAVSKKIARRAKIRSRIRSKVAGTAVVPRLAIYKSNSCVYAQLIDDAMGHTLAETSSKALDLKNPTVEAAEKVGEAIAEKALAKGIKQVVFDRSGYIYHGKVKQLATGARAKGLKF